MPISLDEEGDPNTWNVDPLRSYNALYLFLDQYRMLRAQHRILVASQVCLAAQRILDIDEDVRESYGCDTRSLDDGAEGLALVASLALDQYRRNVRLYGWALDTRVVRHAQMLVNEGPESDKIEEQQRQEMRICRSSFEAAREAMMLHLTSYVASIRRSNGTNQEIAWRPGQHVLAAASAVERWASGDTRKLRAHHFLRSENMRNWGLAGYTAKIISIYYWALRKTNRGVDVDVLLAIKDVLALEAELCDDLL